MRDRSSIFQESKRMSLFGRATTSRASNQHLVEFKAGKLSVGSNNVVTPVLRKGLIYVYQSEESLVHFCWKDRDSGEVVDDLIVFPDDAVFKHIPSERISAARCDRIYALKFKSSSRKFLFWMQEPTSDKDAELAAKVNDLLNNPPAPGSGLGGGGGGGGSGGLSQQSIAAQYLQFLNAGGLDFGSLQALLGDSLSSSRSSADGTAASSSAPALAIAESSATSTSTTASPSTTSTATNSSSATSASSADPIRVADLQSVLSATNLPQGAHEEPVDLAGVMTPDNFAAVIGNPAANDQLISHLPRDEGLGQAPDQLRETLASPQFRQAMETFLDALQSGHLGPLMDHLGMSTDVSAAAAQGDVEAFMQSMERNENQEEEGDEEKEKEDGRDRDD